MLRFVPILCAVAALAGCRARDLEWEIVFDPPSLADRAERLDVRIARGACPGTEVVLDATIVPASGEIDLPELEEGTWCFSARAGDASCDWFAGGQAEVDLPRDDGATVRVVAVAIPPEPNCAATCEAGACTGGGGGGTTCSGSDVCNPTCSGALCDFTCTDASVCEPTCTGSLCQLTCASAASCDFTCGADSCNVTCEGSSSCNVDCAGRACSLTCRDGASCDFRCSGGACSFACEGTGTCTTDCGGGFCSGP